MSARLAVSRARPGSCARDLIVKQVPRRDEIYWAVFEGSVQISWLYPHEHQARAAMESERAKDKPREIRKRPCLCCGVTIDSEGPHHRMCGSCRTQSQPTPV